MIIHSGIGTGSLQASGSFGVLGDSIFSGSINVTQGITGSLFGTASYAQEALSASYALTASFALNVNPSATASYALQALTASHALTASSADNFLVRQDVTASNLLVNGTITAQTLSVQIVTSSVSFVTGSTKSGTLLSNTHEFTGSVSITGSLSVNGVDYEATSASFDSRITNNSASIALLSSSFLAASGSFSTRVSDLEAFSASLDTGYVTEAELAAATASLSASIALLSSSYLDSSASFDTRINANSASIALLSSSFTAFSSSYNTGSFTGSFIGSLFGTASNAVSASYSLSSSYAVSASHAVLADTASFVTSSNVHGPFGANSILSASYAQTSSYAIRFNVSQSLTASGLRYPIADGAFSGQVLQTNAAGTLSFGDVNALYETVYNAEATTLTKGTLVYVSGSQGANPKVFRADAANPSKMPVIFVIAEAIAPAATGRGLVLGLLTGIDTDGLTPGTQLWTDGSGSLTAVRPTGSSDIVQPMGIVVKSGTGGQINILNPGPVILPNLQKGYAWIGDGTNYPVAVTTSSIQNVVSASYAGFAQTIASGLNITASNLLVTNNITASSITATSASFGYVQSITGSAVIVGQEYIVLNTQQPAARFAGLIIYDSGSQYTASVVWDSERNHLVYQNASASAYTGGGFLSGPRNSGSLGEETYPTLNRIVRGQGGDHLYDSNISDDDTKVTITIPLVVTGSVTATGDFVGSLFGTASWANNAITSSFALQAATASYVLQAVSASFATLAQTANTASFVTASNVFGPFGSNSVTSASFAVTSSFATTASFVLNAVSASFASTASFVNPLRQTVEVTGSLRVTGSATLNGNNVVNTAGGTTNTISKFTGASTLGNSIITDNGTTVAITSTNDTLYLRTAVQGAGNIFSVEAANTSIAGYGILKVLDAGTANITLVGNGGQSVITGSLDVTAGITGSLFGTASWARNTLTASFIQTAVSASHALTASYVLPLRQTVEITGSTAALSIIGSGSGVFTVDGTFGRLLTVNDSNSGSLFSVYTGSLGIFEVFSDKRVDISGSVTITGSLTLDDTLTDYARVDSSAAGSNTVFTQATGSYTSAFFKYTVSSGSNARSGEVMAVWSGATAEFTDTSTTDIGNTAAVSCSVALSGGNVQFNISTNTSGWRLKSLATFM